MSRSTPPSLPQRPRLADHVLVRRHLAAGQEIVVLHDTKTGRTLQIGRREWGLLASADGTRDVEGIVLAASREGAFARAPALHAFLSQLHQAGMISGEGEGDAPEDAPQLDIPADRPLDALSGFSLACDGRGSCCRIYASVLFAPLEAARARAERPEVFDGGARHSHVFTPDQGSGPRAGAAVALVDGRCAYLAEGGLCSIHAAAGERAKPFGCRLFPVTFADDGEAVRVSVAVECACVLASQEPGAREGGAPLLPPGAKSRGDLDAAVFIAQVPEVVRLAASTSSPQAPRAAVARFSRAVLRAASPDADAIASFWALASAVEEGDLSEASAQRALSSTRARVEELLAPAPEDILPWVEALRDRAARRAREDAAWRSELDLARLATRWIERSAAALLEPGACAEALRAAPAAERAEAFYLRAVIHGHHLLTEDAPLAGSLRDRSVRLLVARAMRGVLERAAREGEAGAADPAARYPLTLVEAMLRGHGLESYRSDIEGP